MSAPWPVNLAAAAIIMPPAPSSKGRCRRSANWSLPVLAELLSPLSMNGLLLVDKPCGITSFDVVRKVRRWCGTRQVGHCGTLDPAASGVLPVAVGSATRLVEYLITNDKEYVATLCLGVVTDTQDGEGRVLATRDWTGHRQRYLAGCRSRFCRPASSRCRRCIRRSSATGCHCTGWRARGSRWNASRAPCASTPSRSLPLTLPDGHPTRDLQQGDLYPHSLPRSRPATRLRCLYGSPAPNPLRGLPACRLSSAVDHLETLATAEQPLPLLTPSADAAGLVRRSRCDRRPGALGQWHCARARGDRLPATDWSQIRRCACWQAGNSPPLARYRPGRGARPPGRLRTLESFPRRTGCLQ